MNGNEVAQQIDMVLERCRRVEAVFAAFKGEGRMATLEEAQQLDTLSQELLDAVRALPPTPCAGMDSTEMKCRTEAVLALACSVLKTVAVGPAKAPAARVPRAASGRVAAYHSF